MHIYVCRHVTEMPILHGEAKRLNPLCLTWNPPNLAVDKWEWGSIAACWPLCHAPHSAAKLPVNMLHPLTGHTALLSRRQIGWGHWSSQLQAHTSYWTHRILHEHCGTSSHRLKKTAQTRRQHAIRRSHQDNRSDYNQNSNYTNTCARWYSIHQTTTALQESNHQYRSEWEG